MKRDLVAPLRQDPHCMHRKRFKGLGLQSSVARGRPDSESAFPGPGRATHMDTLLKGISS